jgi:hypothetical protein
MTDNKIHLLMNKKIFLFGLALLFLCIGGLIYLCFRQPTIVLFRWLDLIGFNYSIFQSVDIELPSFFVYNFPNILFILFCYIIVFIIWENKKYYCIFYSSLVTMLVIIYEIVTKDIDDMIATLITFILCLIIYTKYLGVKNER